MAFFGRTDLASEAHRLKILDEGDSAELEGVIVREDIYDGIHVSSVDILNEQGERALSKPVGKYFTLEFEKPYTRGAPGFERLARLISRHIIKCGDFSAYRKFLVAALGNEDITPDALGPAAASFILVTSHLKKSSPESFAAFSDACLCRTGVLGTTGIESAELLKLLCHKTGVDCLIVIDALAGADVSRLCQSVQICSSGIAPGSGVGNNRAVIDRSGMGCDVIAVGMPTVIDAAFLSQSEGLESMFVTPRDIDALIKAAGRLIAYGINLAIHPGLSVEDIDMLIG